MVLFVDVIGSVDSDHDQGFQLLITYSLFPSQGRAPEDAEAGSKHKHHKATTNITTQL